MAKDEKHEHAHEHCKHEHLKYCAVCKLVFCQDCKREWQGNPGYYFYTYPTYSGTGTWTWPSTSTSYKVEYTDNTMTKASHCHGD